jgi:arginyl-tRNA--protein-N-Asp/Glu arginylyltransferase
MAEPTNSLFQEAERIKEKLEPYFVRSPLECPYGLPFRAVYNQALFDSMPDFIMGSYLAAGYRRNGNIIYNMHCSGCEACIPIRLDPKEFRPDRNQKRVWHRNRDITIETGPLSCSGENLALLGKFLSSRYPGRDSSPLDYYTGFFLNHITNTLEFSYRVGAELIGVAIVDLSTDWLNVVFFYFDPAAEKRSPGTYNILYLIDFCLHQAIQYIYLGYWIADVQAMRYKARFKPHQVFRGGTWQPVKR